MPELTPDPTHPRKRLVTDESLEASYAAVVAAQAAYEAEYDAHKDGLHPEATAAELRAALRQLTNPQDLDTARKELSEWTGAAAKEQKARSRSLILVASNTYRQAFGPLLDAAESVLDDLRIEAQTAEQEFAEAWGIEPEVTGLSRRVETVAAELARFREQVQPKPHDGILPPARSLFSDIVAYFDPSQYGS